MDVTAADDVHDDHDDNKGHRDHDTVMDLAGVGAQGESLLNQTPSDTLLQCVPKLRGRSLQD